MPARTRRDQHTWCLGGRQLLLPPETHESFQALRAFTCISIVTLFVKFMH